MGLMLFAPPYSLLLHLTHTILPSHILPSQSACPLVDPAAAPESGQGGEELIMKPSHYTRTVFMLQWNINVLSLTQVKVRVQIKGISNKIIPGQVWSENPKQLHWITQFIGFSSPESRMGRSVSITVVYEEEWKCEDSRDAAGNALGWARMSTLA